MAQRHQNPVYDYVKRSDNEAARGKQAALEVIAAREQGAPSYGDIDGLCDAAEAMLPRNPAYYGAYVSTLRDYLNALEQGSGPA